MSSFLSFFLDWKVKIALALVVISAAYFYHLSEVKVAVNEAVTQIEAQVSRESFKLKERSLNAKIELEQEFDNIQKEKNAKIQTLNARVASLTLSLSSRPNRPEQSGVPNTTGIEENKPGATGAQLYREDGIVLAREAARAELIKEELLGCYRSYDEAKNKLDKFKASNSPTPTFKLENTSNPR